MIIMKKTAMSVLICSGLLAATIYSCKKETTPAATTPAATPVEQDTQSATDNSVAESEYTSAADDANDIMSNESGALKTALGCSGLRGCNNCVNWSIDTCGVYFPKVITLDFGTTGCLGCDGKTRKGKLIITLSGKWKTANSTATIVTSSYFVNDNQFDGQIILTNLTGSDSSSATLPSFSKVVSKIGDTADYSTVTLSSGSTIKWKCNRTITMTSGHTTPINRNDDSFTSYGSASGINRAGASFSVDVPSTTPVKKVFSCKWVQDGQMTLTPANLNPRTLNFAYPNAQGSGVCDGDLQVSVNGVTVNVTMP